MTAGIWVSLDDLTAQCGAGRAQQRAENVEARLRSWSRDLGR